MSDKEDLERAAEVVTEALDSAGVDELREMGRWMLYMLWKTDEGRPPWYGTPEELEAFERGPNPFLMGGEA